MLVSVGCLSYGLLLGVYIVGWCCGVGCLWLGFGLWLSVCWVGCGCFRWWFGLCLCLVVLVYCGCSLFGCVYLIVCLFWFCCFYDCVGFRFVLVVLMFMMLGYCGLLVDVWFVVWIGVGLLFCGFVVGFVC